MTPHEEWIKGADPGGVLDDLPGSGEVAPAARLDFRDRLRQWHRLPLVHDALRLERDDVAAFAGDNRLEVRRPSIECRALLRFISVFVVSPD
jgi:hypothetical protein